MASSSELENKLNYLDGTKSLIKQAMKNKGINVTDDDTFREYADFINNLELKADESDSTVQANEIELGKIAYSNNEKIIGTLPSYSSINLTATSVIDDNINSNVKSYANIDSRLILNSSSSINMNVDYNQLINTYNISSDKLKKDFTLFGIVGNIEESTDGVKLFDTEVNMRNDPNPIEGDLALVYKTGIESLTPTSTFDKFILYKTISVSDLSYYGYFDFQGYSESEGKYSGLRVNLSGYSIEFEIYTWDCYGTIRYDRMYNPETYEYTNEYILNENHSDLNELQVQIFDDYILVPITPAVTLDPYYIDKWNNILGEIIKLDVTNFGGLYEYKNNNYLMAKTQLDADAKYVYKKTFYGLNGSQQGTLQSTENLANDDIVLKAEIFDSLYDITTSSTNLANLFQGKFYKVVPNINTENVINMSGMFAGCGNLIGVPNLNTSNVEDMSNIFSGCCNLTNVPEIDTYNVINMSGMFAGCRNLYNYPYLSTEKVTDMSKMFYYASVYDSSPILQYFDTHNVTNMSGIFAGSHIISVPNINTVNVVNMSNMFSGLDGLRRVNDIITSNVQDMSRMFYMSHYLVSVNGFNTVNVVDMHEMFDGCCMALTDTPNLDTSNVINMYKMFSNCRELINVLNYNTSNVNNMAYMFNWCGKLTTVPNFDTSNVINMTDMFHTCYNLTTVPNFNTSKVINMAEMFYGCTDKLKTVPNFDTSNVTDMRWMFFGCENLINAPNFNMVNVSNVYNMFADCYKLNNVPAFNFNNVKSLTNMFVNCYKLINIPLFNTSKVINMAWMFFNCPNIRNVPVLNTSNATTIRDMFGGCNNLSNASIQNIINMCLNSNVTASYMMNLNNSNQYSPLYGTKFNSRYYSNRLTELNNAGWKY